MIGFFGLIGKGGDMGYGGSRDYCLPQIPCRISQCPCNDTLGKCICPSFIKIGPDGVCEMAKKVFADEAKK